MNRIYGNESECRLEQFFLDTHNAKKTIGKYDLFDYESESTLIELKTRRNFHNTYFDTMIGANKVEEGCRQLNKKTKERVLFYFQFTDGLFYYELKEDFVLRRDYFKGKAYHFIPVELLKQVEGTGTPCPVRFLNGI
jgi:hypothetical protein